MRRVRGAVIVTILVDVVFKARIIIRRKKPAEGSISLNVLVLLGAIITLGVSVLLLKPKTVLALKNNFKQVSYYYQWCYDFK